MEDTKLARPSHFNKLAVLDPSKPHKFIRPTKRINEGHDVTHFLSSKAYSDIITFIMQLNIAMCPRISDSGQIETWQLDTPISYPETVLKLQELLRSVENIIEEAPPDPGPRRFGNISFRKWHALLEERTQELLKRFLPALVVGFNSGPTEGDSALDELTSYFLGSFGSSQRLDYGTGHELSFLAFLGSIWKLGGFGTDQTDGDGSLERCIVIGVIEQYLRVIRKLILTYTLEPAGSHGVWGLDDHSFIPYIFGSSQYSPAIKEYENMPVEGSLAKAPKPSDIVKKNIVDQERPHNMYFSAVGFINDVKTGPFWEHSPILFDISGIRAGWGKINKGMLKMYNAEVLSKFPVVQHFPFGSLFSWDIDPHASYTSPSVHVTSQPTLNAVTSAGAAGRSLPQGGTKAPWAAQTSATRPFPQEGTVAPWTNRAAGNGRVGLTGNDSGITLPRVAPGGPTRAPWTESRDEKRS
ncbi:serine/threonine-protein phosphatase-like protein 2A activator 1 [Xylogone sp. PMI_703]|nr:serine/threonine-protein phosphatase-like protein 2A activator 1 [Xylogone sp. PMI_703]